ncbi:MAG: DUF6468 domain-containing protein [Kordiimonas sp.]
MTPFSELIVDGILALLLIAVIGVCLMVSRRLGTIRSGQAELRAIVDQLNTAVADAQRSVVGLKTSADEVAGKLRVEQQKATAIMDELAMITEAGNNLADRIEQGLTGGAAAADAGSVSPSKESRKQQEEILAALKEAR